MTVALVFAACLALGQPQESSVLKKSGDAGSDTPTAGPLVPIKNSRPQVSSPELMAALLVPAKVEPLAGQPMALVDAVSKAGNRARQRDVVAAYWNCLAALAEYHACRLDHEQFKWLVDDRQAAEPNFAPAAAADLAIVAAQIKEAELRAVAAQSELAEKLGMAATSPLPLPSDAPTVAKYRTLLAEMYANRQVPPRLKLLDRSLGLRPKAIDLRAEAVQSAVNALEAVQEGYREGHVGADSFVQCVWQLSKQRKAFIEAVKSYNLEIAEYALAVARETDSPAAVTGMLIKTEHTNAVSTGGTTFEAGRAATRQGPTPTFAPTQPSGSLADQSSESPAVNSILRREGAQRDTATASRDNKATPTPAAAVPGTRMSPRERSDQLQTRYKLYDEVELAAFEKAAAQAESSAYAGLIDLQPPKRTQRLVSLLHWDRRANDSSTSPISLDEFLARSAGSQRRAMLAAYWKASETAARQQCLVDRAAALQAIVSAVLKQRTVPGGGEAMVQLRAAQAGADADVYDSQIALYAAEFELTRAAGRSLDQAWLHTSTAPHGGRYDLQTEAQSATAQSRAVKSLVTGIPALHGSLQDRSEAIVRGDALRTSTLAAYQGGSKPFEAALRSVETQHEQTSAFLDTLTRYNLAIADYVLAVMSPQSLPEQLTAALVVKAR